jgi:hypothetical protein
MIDSNVQASQLMWDGKHGCEMIDMDACISQLIWLMPLIDSDVHDLQTIRHD